LLLIDWLDYVALRFEGDVVVVAKIFFNDADRGYLAHYVSNVDVLPWDGFDDIVIVALKILDVLVWNAILDEIIMMLQIKLLCCAF
jgi:uncharacterized protein YkuJ